MQRCKGGEAGVGCQVTGVRASGRDEGAKVMGRASSPLLAVALLGGRHGVTSLPKQMKLVGGWDGG